MAQLFNPDGPVMRFITKVVHSVWLNILWFICCIPIITIGPSTTALFYACQRMVRDEESYTTRDFFHSFRQNFKQGTVIGLIMTGVGILFAADGYVLYHLRGTSAFWTILTAIYLVALAGYAIVAMWIFPLLANFDNTTFAMFRNSIMLGMRFLMCTVFMAGVYFIMLLIVVRIMTPFVIFGMGTCAFANSYLLQNILLQCEAAEMEEDDGE